MAEVAYWLNNTLFLFFERCVCPARGAGVFDDCCWELAHKKQLAKTTDKRVSAKRRVFFLIFVRLVRFVVIK